MFLRGFSCFRVLWLHSLEGIKKVRPWPLRSVISRVRDPPNSQNRNSQLANCVYLLTHATWAITITMSISGSSSTTPVRALIGETTA